MKHVAANVTAAAFIASIALLVAPATIALADANPNNEGHHYGQLKHHPTPPPSPNPQPAPQPTPHTNPTAPHGVSSAVQTGTGTTAPAAKPQADTTPVAVPSIVLGNAAPSPDALWWLVLVILPALAVIWLIAAARIAVGVGRALSRRSLRTAPAV